MKKALLVLVAITMAFSFTACKEEKPPADGTPTTVQEQAPALTAAINTGCAVGKAYLTIDSYWMFARPFIPANILTVATPALGLFLQGLKAYGAAVITWADTKAQPKDFELIKKNLIELQAQVTPLIQQIMALVKPDASKDLMAATRAMEQELASKGVFSCTIDEFKALTEQIKVLQPLT